MTENGIFKIIDFLSLVVIFQVVCRSLMEKDKILELAVESCLYILWKYNHEMSDGS
jgi:hypothetical protein